jgi:pimeloyl-ACP methyl ester carboxylesterase
MEVASALPNPLGAERRRFAWRGHDIAYVRSGEGPPVVLVHAIHACSWSMEWRNTQAALAERFTTFSFDWLGFGASAHPPLAYTSALYVELLRDFLAEEVREPAALIGSSLGGTYAIAVAARSPSLVTRVCAIGPAGVTRLTNPAGKANGWVEDVFRSPNLGRTLFSAMVSKASIRFFLKGIYHDPKVMTDEVVDLYWQSAQQPNARFAPSAFVGMKLNLDIRGDIATMPAELLLVWGEHATQTPLKEASGVRALRPSAPLVVLPGGDLPHEESPREFLAAVTPFLEGRAVS